MFKVSQEIYLGASDSANHSKTYGSYQTRPSEDTYTTRSTPVFVAPEVTEVNKIQVLHFPETNICIDKPFEFIIRKNGARGNVQVKVTAGLRGPLRAIGGLLLSAENCICGRPII